MDVFAYNYLELVSKPPFSTTMVPILSPTSLENKRPKVRPNLGPCSPNSPFCGTIFSTTHAKFRLRLLFFTSERYCPWKIMRACDSSKQSGILSHIQPHSPRTEWQNLRFFYANMILDSRFGVPSCWTRKQLFHLHGTFLQATGPNQNVQPPLRHWHLRFLLPFPVPSSCFHCIPIRPPNVSGQGYCAFPPYCCRTQASMPLSQRLRQHNLRCTVSPPHFLLTTCSPTLFLYHTYQ